MSEVRAPQPREKPELLALVTGILAFFTGLLAAAAFLQVHALVDATRISERAWVTVKSAQFINIVVGQKPTAIITVENTGNKNGLPRQQSPIAPSLGSGFAAGLIGGLLAAAFARKRSL